jgi:TolA-binding protein
MTRFDLHPEDLIDRANRGTANAAELVRLEQHLAECAVCRVERALMAQAASDAAPLRDETLLVARLKHHVAPMPAARGATRSKRKRALVAVALAVGTAASAAAAATYVIVRGAAAPQAVMTAPPSQRAQPAAAQPGARTPQRGESRELVAAEVETARPSGKQSDPEPARPALPAVAEPTSSSELFSRANQARRDGKVTEAARLYRALQERFSGSSEELVSRVTLGRLLLDRLGDSRGALVQFNSYLASPGGGVLREEAMVGRALSLGRMGRVAEERAAWQALLDSFPKSTQRKRAQARLVELGGAAAGAVRAGDGAGGAERTP